MKCSRGGWVGGAGDNDNDIVRIENEEKVVVDWCELY